MAPLCWRSPIGHNAYGRRSHIPWRHPLLSDTAECQLFGMRLYIRFTCLNQDVNLVSVLPIKVFLLKHSEHLDPFIFYMHPVISVNAGMTRTCLHLSSLIPWYREPEWLTFLLIQRSSSWTERASCVLVVGSFTQRFGVSYKGLVWIFSMDFTQEILVYMTVCFWALDYVTWTFYHSLLTMRCTVFMTIY